MIIGAFGQPVIDLRSKGDGFDGEEVSGENMRPMFLSDESRAAAEYLMELVDYSPPTILRHWKDQWLGSCPHWASDTPVRKGAPPSTTTCHRSMLIPVLSGGTWAQCSIYASRCHDRASATKGIASARLAAVKGP